MRVLHSDVRKHLDVDKSAYIYSFYSHASICHHGGQYDVNSLGQRRDISTYRSDRSRGHLNVEHHVDFVTFRPVRKMEAFGEPKK